MCSTEADAGLSKVGVGGQPTRKKGGGGPGVPTLGPMLESLHRGPECEPGWLGRFGALDCEPRHCRFAFHLRN